MKALFTAIACSLFSTLAASSCVAKEEPAPPKKPCAWNCECVKFDVLAAALYLQPNGSKLYYGAEAITLNPDIAFPPAGPSWNILEVKPKYHVAFDVGTKFSFVPTNLNLFVNFLHFQAKDKASFESPLSSDMVGPFFDIGPNSIEYKNASGSTKYNFDLLTLLVGKQINVLDEFFANFYVGAAFGFIKQTNSATYSNVAETITRTITAPSQFAGVGPQFGVDFAVKLCNCFFFDGGTALTMMMGRLKNSTTFESTTPELAILGIAEPNEQTTSVPNRSQLIPGIEERVGFSYVFTCACGKFTISTGYLAQIYLNAIQSVDMTGQVLSTLMPVTPDVGVFALSFYRTLSNFSVSGPYLSLGFGF